MSRTQTMGLRTTCASTPVPGNNPMHDPRHTSDAQIIAAKLLEAAGRIAPTIAGRRTPSAHEIAQIMDASFATGHTHRRWSPRDAEEACEITIVKDLLSTPLDLQGNTWTEWHTLNRIDDLARREPRHHARTEEQRRHQHFSTPWTIGYVMVQAAELHPGDLALEPSAGLGTLIALACATAPWVR